MKTIDLIKHSVTCNSTILQTMIALWLARIIISVTNKYDEDYMLVSNVENVCENDKCLRNTFVFLHYVNTLRIVLHCVIFNNLTLFTACHNYFNFVVILRCQCCSLDS